MGYIKIQGGTTYKVNLAQVPLTDNQINLVVSSLNGATQINLPKIADLPNINFKILIDDQDDSASINPITIASDPADTIQNGVNYVINTNGGKIAIFVASTNEYGVIVSGNAGGGNNIVYSALLAQQGQEAPTIESSLGVNTNVPFINTLAQPVTTQRVIAGVFRLISVGAFQDPTKVRITIGNSNINNSFLGIDKLVLFSAVYEDQDTIRIRTADLLTNTLQDDLMDLMPIQIEIFA